MSLHPTKPSCVSFFLSTQQAYHQKKQKDFTPSIVWGSTVEGNAYSWHVITRHMYVPHKRPQGWRSLNFSWCTLFYIENGSWVWSYPEIETCTFYQLQHMCMPNELLFNVPASTYTIHKSWSGSYELLFKVRLVSSWSSINNSLIKV